MEDMYRILAVDYGEKRIGIALTDPFRMFAKPLVVIPNTENYLYEIKKIVDEQNVGKIVLGLPLNLKGEDSRKTAEVRIVFDKFKEYFSMPIILWDERFTTVEANRILKEQKYSIKEARKVVDKLAASLILKSYLENN